MHPCGCEEGEEGEDARAAEKGKEKDAPSRHK